MEPSSTRLGVIVRVGVFALIAFVAMSVLAPLMHAIGGYLVAATLSTFAAAALANAVSLRIYERGQLADIGLQWNAASRRHLLIGFAAGSGSAFLVLGVPLLTGAAELRPAPDSPASWGTFLFVSLVLLFGVVGEEMLFRGYAFQVLMCSMGPFATILPAGALFGIMHSSNPNTTVISLANTMAWGVLLGCAFLRSGDLWLPIGLHFGWNWVLPMFGVNLSGFTMKITGYAMHWKIGALWSGGDYGPEAGLLTSLLVVGLAVVLFKAPVRPQIPYLLRVSGKVEP